MHGTPRSVVAQFRDRLYGFAAVSPKYHACRRPQSTTLRCWPLLAVVKRIPERLHTMRLQDRERLRQCARVVRHTHELGSKFVIRNQTHDQESFGVIRICGRGNEFV